MHLRRSLRKRTEWEGGRLSQWSRQEMMVAWPKMVEWKWRDRKLPDKMGSETRVRELRLFPLPNVWHGKFISCVVLGKTSVFSEHEDWLGNGMRPWAETEDLGEISSGDSEGRMGTDVSYKDCQCNYLKKP